MTDGAGVRGNVVIAGVGGQGAVLAATVLAQVCVDHGLDVKTAEVHGMSQRGGAVSVQVRFGTEVHGMQIEKGQLDWLLGFEWAEALRWLPYLSPTGKAFVSTEQIVPPAALLDRASGKIHYPFDDISDHRWCLVDAVALAREAGDVRTRGVVLLGAFSKELPFPPESWQDALRRVVPSRACAVNLRAFELGRQGRPVAVSPSRRKVPEAALRAAVLRLNEAWCKGCGICVDVCPERVWQLNDHNLVEVVAPERCTGCLLCEKLCPDLAIEVAVNPQGLAMGRGGLDGSSVDVR